MDIYNEALATDHAQSLQIFTKRDSSTQYTSLRLVHTQYMLPKGSIKR